MQKKWLIVPAVFLLIIACNNGDTGSKETTAQSADHSGHGMAMTDSKGYADSVNNGLIKEDTMKGSPARTAMQSVHGTHVHIEYGSPGVKGRIIWGGLVPYDKVWTTGAHHATSVQFYKDVTIGGTTVPKGIYAIFTIPGSKEWTIILNRNYEQHLTDNYSEKDDIIRVKATPEEHPFTARLTYSVEELPGNKGAISIAWDKLVIKLPFKTV